MLSKLTKISVLIFITFFIIEIFSFLYFILPIATVQADSSMPNWTMPDIQIDISGLKGKFSPPTQCGTDSNGQPVYCVKWIAEYVAAVYKYAIGIVGILAAVVLMIGGIIWLTAGGSATRVGEAKSWIGASLTGLLIALCSYMILYQINPDLVNLKPIKVTMVPKTVTPAANNTTKTCEWKNVTLCSELTGNWTTSAESECNTDSKISGYKCCCKTEVAYTGNCQSPTSGSCSQEALSYTCFGPNNTNASIICYAESNGDPTIGSKVDKCSDGNSASWGLFQINISVHKLAGLDCPSAFSKPYSNSSKDCKVINQTLYNQCVNLAMDPKTNTNAACEIYKKGGWSQWGAAQKCGIK